MRIGVAVLSGLIAFYTQCAFIVEGPLASSYRLNICLGVVIARGASSYRYDVVFIAHRLLHGCKC